MRKNCEISSTTVTKSQLLKIKFWQFKTKFYSLGVYIYQESVVLPILRHIQTTTVTNLTYHTTGQLRKVPKMYHYSLASLKYK